MCQISDNIQADIFLLSLVNFTLLGRLVAERDCLLPLFLKNLNFVAGMTRRFVSAKRLIRYFPNSSKLVEHRAQSPVREVKMLDVRYLYFPVEILSFITTLLHTVERQEFLCNYSSLINSQCGK